MNMPLSQDVVWEIPTNNIQTIEINSTVSLKNIKDFEESLGNLASLELSEKQVQEIIEKISGVLSSNSDEVSS